MNVVWRRLGLVLLAFAVIGLVLPSRVHVQRSIDIDARRAMVFALLNDFRWVAEWSTRTEDDPNARIDFSGPQRGMDATCSWDGQIAGKGHERIVVSEPYAKVETVVTIGGRETHSVFMLADEGTNTRLDWTWERDFGFNLPGRYFALFMSRIVGRRMDTELGKLGALAESLPRADFADLQAEHFFEEEQEIAYRRTTSFPEATAISEAMGGAFFEILNFIDRNDLEEAGAPLSITRTFSGSELVFDAAIPVRNITDDTPAAENGVNLGATYEGPVIRVRHIGPYSTLGRTHDKIAAYLAAMRLTRNGDAWEAYVSDPTRTDASELLTYIYYPVTE
jgi:effector-binding domain-containing protein